MRQIVNTLIALALLATTAHADIYKYRTPDGKLVIGNRPPEGVTSEYERRPATPVSDTQVSEPTSRPKDRGAGEPSRSYVDLNPLVIGRPQVQDTEVWWKKIVTGVVENRSGRTQVEALLVEVDCGSYQQNQYIGTVEPRGRRRYSVTIILDGDRAPSRMSRHTPALSCAAGATWTNVF